jgi:hypothetical protein
LVHIAQSDALAALALRSDSHFHLVTSVQHYDGAYYYAIARDPLLNATAHNLIDQPAYRYGHPLHGWLAYLLSLGRPAAVPLALMVLSLLGLAAAGWAVSRLATAYGRSPWGGLLVATSPGLLFAATVDTTETVGAALIAVAFLAWYRQRYAVAGLLLVMTCFDKEQYITVPLGLIVWEAVTSWRSRWIPDALAVKVIAVTSGPVLLAGWYAYVHSRVGRWPFQYESGNLGAPLEGWRNTLRLAHDLSGGSFEQSQIGSVTPAILTAIAAVIVMGAFAARRILRPFDATAIGMAVIASMQGWRTLLYPHEVFRLSSIAVLLALAVLFTRPPPDRLDSTVHRLPG